MNSIANLERRRKEVEERLDRRWQPERSAAVMEPVANTYELSSRVTGSDIGGLGAIVETVKALGVAELIDERVQLFKRHFPYHESDHILSLTYSMMSGKATLDELSSRRNDMAFLDAVNARRIPHPTTAGDFLRRFDRKALVAFLGVLNDCSAKVWQRRPEEDRQLAVIDMDGTIAETTGHCREGMAMAYEGTWGYHPLVVSLANSQEVLAVVNRPGNHSSNTGATEWIDRAVSWAKERAGFSSVLLRGDSAFAITRNFDRWSEEGTEFVFAIMAHRSFETKAEAVAESEWVPFTRAARTKGERAAQENVRQRVVEENGYKDLRLESEHLTEWEYTPKYSRGTYRMIVLRKTIKVVKGQLRLSDETRYFFYATNIPACKATAEEIVRQSNARCNQENLIDQLKNGVGATRMPSVSFEGNWAHMLVASLAWNLKTWLALLVADHDHETSDALVRAEFKTFVEEFIRTPVQIIRHARRVVFRLININRWSRFLLDVPRLLRGLRFA